MKLILGLSQSKVSYFDPITKMHFHLQNSVQEVPKNANTKGLKKAVKCKTLFIIEGSFDNKKDKEEASKTKKLEKKEVKVNTKEKKSPKSRATKKEQPKKEQPKKEQSKKEVKKEPVKKEEDKKTSNEKQETKEKPKGDKK